MFFFTVSNSIVTFPQARGKYFFAILSLVLASSQVIGMVFFHKNLNGLVLVMAAVGVTSFVLNILSHLLYEPIKTLARNTLDFLGIFTSFSGQNLGKVKNKKILIFNWRDTKHVWAGGAEVYVREIAKRLVEKGYIITLFCGNDGHSPRNQTIDGIQIVRRGGFYTVYVWAFLYYIFRFRGKYDAIIDSENGIPFFTPLFVGKPTIGLIHHVHQEVFRTKLKFPLAQIGKFLEGKMMPLIYRHTQMITVSNSSKEDMQRIGLGKKFPIEIIHPGIDLAKFKPAQKTKQPTILYLGRLQPYKSLEVAIYAMQIILKKIPYATLTIAGEGESRNELEKLVHSLKLNEAVKFLGKVTEETKTRLFAKSWVMVQPSKIEGWGITAIEANASGTPVVASNVAGLRDSVSNPHSGYLVPWGQPQEFAQKIELILTNKKIRKGLEKESVLWAKQFCWEESTEKLTGILNKEIS
jgi:glycosyltransferase involved in cell wall biosynthesis